MQSAIGSVDFIGKAQKKKKKEKKSTFCDLEKKNF
jgi:hypothetical protein